MILLELFNFIFDKLFYWISRPIVWLITARDCRHCRYGGFRQFTNGYRWNTFNYGCKRDLIEEDKCKDTSWRCNFEKRKRK